MRKIILLSILVVCLGLFFINQKGRGIFPKEKLYDIEGFYKLTLEDPLFYSSFFDAREFEKATEKLEETENKLKETIIKRPDNKKDVPILNEYDIFPHQFLGSLVLTNIKTKEFLQNPVPEKAEILLELYDLVANYYVQDVSSKIEILEELIDPNKPYLYFFVDSISSLETVKNDFITIRENGYKLKEEIDKRRGCLAGKLNCQELLTVKDNNSFFEILEESEKFNLEGEKIDFIKDTLTHDKIRGPYKIKSKCWQGPNFEHWMYLIYISQADGNFILPKLATENYYWKVQLSLPYNEPYSENKDVFSFQPESTTYQCPDLTFYPQLLVLDFLKERMEKGITKEDIEKNLDYKLLMENQFGLISPAINAISSQLEFLRLINEASIAQGNPATVNSQFLFSNRSCYSLLYFPFAKSIWRIDKQLQYFIPEEEKTLLEVKSSDYYLSLGELEKMGYTREEIKEFPYQWEILQILFGIQ